MTYSCQVMGDEASLGEPVASSTLAKTNRVVFPADPWSCSMGRSILNVAHLMVLVEIPRPA